MRASQILHLSFFTLLQGVVGRQAQIFCTNLKVGGESINSISQTYVGFNR